MGVYVIASKHSKWIKIGHHKISSKRPNVYYRYINRGFYSCLCPPEIKHLVSFEDLELLYWFPNLATRQEKQIHKYFRNDYNFYGEWFENIDSNLIRDVIIEKFGGIEEPVTEEQLANAKQWCNYDKKN
jgi:abortive infection bacteriophage resistance protein